MYPARSFVERYHESAYLPPVAAIGVVAAVAMIRTAAADSPVPCSGDDAACQNINITQRGADQQSWRAFLMRFDTRRGMGRSQ